MTSKTRIRDIFIFISELYMYYARILCPRGDPLALFKGKMRSFGKLRSDFGSHLAIRCQMRDTMMRTLLVEFG